MPALNQLQLDTSAPALQSSVQRQRKQTIRVYMMEMWSFIPYYVARLCASLSSEAVEPTLGSVRYHLDRKYFRNAGLKPDRALLDAGGGIKSSFLRRIIKSCEYLTNLFVLGLRLRASRTDILHVQFLPFLERQMPFEIWFLKWIRRRGIRIVYTVHNVTRQDAPKRGIPLFCRAYSLADALICHGEEARSELVRDFGVAREKIWVIPHGPLFEEPPKLSPQEARSTLGLSSDEPLVLSMGVISQYKGIPFLLDAWKRLQKSGVKARLLIAGTGDPGVIAEVQAKVGREKLEGSVDLWLRFIAVEQLPLLYQAADILVYPYNAGTTSGALLTGMNYGKAIVATRLPFFQENLKDGETALLVNYGDEKALAWSLQKLILRREQRERLGSAVVRQASREISWQEIAKKTRECYEKVLAAGS